jgi:hypothetical protein
MANEFEIPCPHQDCGEALHLVWSLIYTFQPADLLAEWEPPVTATGYGHAQSWQVECGNGHVILLPGPLGCPCEPGLDDECPHNEDDYEWSEDWRDFRSPDVQRLRAVIQKIREPFNCPAVFHHGPGSHSRTRCERHDPHDITDEHYARDPMHPGFEWTGKDG